MTDPSIRPLVSIIIPNYNYERSIGLCVQAALSQTYPNVEVIVIDDGSTDRSPEIAEELGARVVRTPVNGGVSAARNLGAELAGGEVLMFVDSDVAVNPDAVEKAVGLLEQHPEYGAVCGIYEPEPLLRDSLVEEYRCLQHHYLLLNSAGIIATVHTAIFAVPAAVFREIGPFNTRLRQTEDQDYGERMSARYKVLSSADVRGRHDDDDTFRLMLRKVFVRARLALPLILGSRRLQGGYVTGPRAMASLGAPLVLAAVAAPILLGPLWTLLPVALYVLSALGDLDMYRVVRRQRSLTFTAYFVAVSFLMNLTVSLAVGVAGIQWLVSREFRHLYDESLAPESTAPPSPAAKRTDAPVSAAVSGHGDD